MNKCRKLVKRTSPIAKRVVAVERWCWESFQCRGVSVVGLGPIVLAVGAIGTCSVQSQEFVFKSEIWLKSPKNPNSRSSSLPLV